MEGQKDQFAWFYFNLRDFPIHAGVARPNSGEVGCLISFVLWYRPALTISTRALTQLGIRFWSNSSDFLRFVLILPEPVDVATVEEVVVVVDCSCGYSKSQHSRSGDSLASNQPTTASSHNRNLTPYIPYVTRFRNDHIAVTVRSEQLKKFLNKKEVAPIIWEIKKNSTTI